MFKTFNDILTDLFNSIIGNGGKMTDFNVGSVARTMLEAVAAVVEDVWFYLQLFVSKFFIATSSGEWLDRRLNDFGLYRKPGAQASGIIKIDRSTPNPIGTFIPAGTLFVTDQTVKFITTADATLAVGATTIQIPAGAVDIGAAGNLPQGTLLKQAGIAIAGIETVTVAQMGGGIDIETDDALKDRVKPYFQSLGRSTLAAIRFAAMSVQGVASVTVIENDPAPGFFKVYIDDGTGTASAATVSAVSVMVDAYRAFTVHFSVLTPDRIMVAAAASVVVQDGYNAATVKNNVQTAMLAHANGLQMGQQLYIAALYRVAMEIQGVKNVTVTAPTADSALAANQIARTTADKVVVS